MRQFWLRRKRRHLSRRLIEGAMGRLLQSPLPARGTLFKETEFVCLDVETSGLDAGSAELLSAGWVIVRGGRVALASAEHRVVQPQGEVGNSATVHGLTDTQVGLGEHPMRVLDAILDALAGRVLVVHYAGLDKALLDRLCRERFGCVLPVPVVDTLALEQRRRRHRHHVSGTGSLRLGDLREAYGLPHYHAHDALVDAMSTAELLLAMVSRHAGVDSTRLGDVLTG